MYYFFGKKLQSIRKKKKLTIRELAELIGKTERTIGSWEREERKPSLSDIRVMCDILGITIDEISDISQYTPKKKKDILDNVLSTEDKIQNLFEAKLNIEQKSFVYKLLGVYRGLRKNQEDLQNENLYLKKALNSIPIAIFIKDKHRRYSLVNKHFRHVAKNNNPIGKTNDQILPDNLKNEFNQIDDKVYIKQEAIYSYITSFNDNNFIRHLNISSLPIVENNIVTTTVGCIIDISQQMNSIKNYKLLEFVIDNLSTAVWVRYRKPIKHLVFLNSAIENIVGFSQKEFNTNPNLWKEIIHPEDRIKVGEWSTEWLKKAGKTFFKEHRKYRIIDKKGIVRLVVDERSFFKDDDGEIVDFGLIRDLSPKL